MELDAPTPLRGSWAPGTEGMQSCTVSGPKNALYLHNLRGYDWVHPLKNLGLRVWNCNAEKLLNLYEITRGEAILLLSARNFALHQLTV